MLVSRDGATAVVADSDRDLVSFVDLSARTVRARAQLSPHDEPGRIAEDGAGLVHVALRGSGELATFSLASGQLVGRRSVCAQPRGVAYDSPKDQVVVACATGELVMLPAASGPATSTLTIEPDLRDVLVVNGTGFFVSKFRTAEVLMVTRAGDIVARTGLSPDTAGSTTALAWRMRLWPSQGIMVVYQVDSTSFVSTMTPGGYGSTRGSPSPTSGGGPTPLVPSSPPGGPGLGGIVHTTVQILSTADLSPVGSPHTLGPSAVLPVDIAVAPQTATTPPIQVLVAAGNWKSALTPPYVYPALSPGLSDDRIGLLRPTIDGQLTAAEVADDGTILLQSREPARLYVVQPGSTDSPDVLLATINLSDVSREDTGHTIFHTDSGTGVACASCHGEGADDAQTWNFDGIKPRRTPSLLGTVKGTAPYHWDADFRDLPALMHEVYTKRMGGRALAQDQQAALRGWLELLPGPKRPAVDPAARARGEALFDGKAGCTACHSGPSYTNNATLDVGTGGAFQVPPLVGVGARSPFLHAGCAKTLMDRFTSCATPAHGQTSSLASNEVADLVTFLNSL
jgi:hypothetical protein